MPYLMRYCSVPAGWDDPAAQLREFFSRVRQVRRTLGVDPYLNRLQRNRCRVNLAHLAEIEREFLAIDHWDDLLEMRRRLRRYLYLDARDLARVLSQETVQGVSLFIVGRM
ncbi:hypothetical protein [Nitratifractor sp.]